MKEPLICILLLTCALYIAGVSSCQVEGISNWWLDLSIKDVDRGVFFEGATTDIRGILSASHTGDGLNQGPYFVATHSGSNFVLSLHDNFAQYEEYETAQTMSITVAFDCSNGNSLSVIFIVSITDTNNNPPIFPTNELSFIVTPPLPPGYALTGCLSFINVRDIDLTTQRIEFSIEPNNYFEIAYDSETSNEPKTFSAVLRTKTYVRSIPEPMTIRIDATDVDLTGDPALTTSASLRIEADDSFTLPVEPIFSRVFYSAQYFASGEVSFEQPISLLQGFDSEVKFSIDGEYSTSFELIESEGEITLGVQIPLPENATSPVLLELRAEREFTSGATATIVIWLPVETISPETFEKPFYEGTYNSSGVVEHEVINVIAYTGSVIDIQGDYADYFTAELVNNVVFIQSTNTWVPPEDLEHIVLYLVAGNAESILLLKVIKVTPMSFEKVFYTGSYSENRVQHEIINVLNYVETEIQILGDYSEYFTATTGNMQIIVQSLESWVPDDNIEYAALELVANEARTVLLIDILKSDKIIPTFEKNLYNGIYDTGILVHDVINVFNYNETKVEIIGEFSIYFESNVVEGVVSIQALDSLSPPEQLQFIALELHAGEAQTVLVINIRKEEAEKEYFEKNLYRGTYEEGIFTHEDIQVFAFNGTVIEITGDYGNNFEAALSNGVISIIIPNSWVPPESLEYVALELRAGEAKAVLVIDIIKISESTTLEVFEKNLYKGTYDDGVVSHEVINIYNYNDSTIEISGGFSENFVPSFSNGAIVIQSLQSWSPPEGLEYVALEIRVGAAQTVLIIDMIQSGSNLEYFEKSLYKGVYEDRLVEHEVMNLYNFNGSSPQLTGDFSDYFAVSITNGAVTIQSLASWVPPNQLDYVALELQAGAAKSILLIDIVKNEATSEYFEKNLYKGVINGNVLQHEVISIFNFNGTSIEITGDFSDYFTVAITNGAVTIQSLASWVPPDQLDYVALELQAGAAKTILLIDIAKSEARSEYFEKNLYNGILNDGVLQHDVIIIFNFNGTSIEIFGDYADSFVASFSNGAVTIQTINSWVPPNQLDYVTLELQAGAAKTILLINVVKGEATAEYFEKNLYKGIINDGVLQHEVINIFNFNGTSIEIFGDFAVNFVASLSNGAVTIQAINSWIPPEQLDYLVIELQAGATKTVLIIDIAKSESSEEYFESLLFRGLFSNGSIQHDPIRLFNYNGASIEIIGDYSEYFEASVTDGAVTIQVASSWTPPEELQYVILELRAGAARTVLIVDFMRDEIPSSEYFEINLYTGTFKGGEIQHEEIEIFNFAGMNIEIVGDFANNFESTLVNGVVTVTLSSTWSPPEGLQYIVLELVTSNAKAVLLLDIEDVEESSPSISFSSEWYEIRTNVAQVGIIGQVTATVDNGEDIEYTLENDNAHLQQRLSVNQRGELQLSAPANSGVYTLNVVATTATSRVSSSATVRMIVEAITECSIDDVVLPPLIILEREEETAHRHLVILNNTDYPGCSFVVSNRWPVDHNWVYVDTEGLHANVIDREDPLIAFMTSSQIQVELLLNCDDTQQEETRTKRSVQDELRNSIEPYDYGANEWILSETILYNPKRSFVNIIVKDINDNYPTFVGKENEPIIFGYPHKEIIDFVKPQVLARLHATDADFGDNAALVYWSSDSRIAVSPFTGTVHVRNNVHELNDGDIMTIYATDRNGDGLTGNVDIMLREVSEEHIAIITIQNVFIEDEEELIANLTNALGYEVKILATDVVHEDALGNVRQKREAVLDRGTTIQYFIYGIIQRDLVTAPKLINDINSDIMTSIGIADSISFEDYLESQEICVIPMSGRDLGFFVATIVLSVILFILIGSIAIWQLVKWTKARRYKRLSSQNSSMSQISVVEIPKLDVEIKPRIDIEELKRSERRLQQMLDTPINQAVEKPKKSSTDPKILNLSPETKAAIVIQSIDKLKDAGDESDSEDEFGEKSSNKRKKSVVTFNENVEKIIHMEDIPEDNDSNQEYEIERL